MRQIRRLVGRDLSLSDGIIAFLEVEKALLAFVPVDATIVPLPDSVPGAVCVLMASGSRLLVQYDIQTDTMAAYCQLQYAEAVKEITCFSDGDVGEDPESESLL